MKRLYLSRDKKVFGVCGGIGDYFEVDPTMIRLAWIVMTILTGVVPGIVAYFVMAIVMPSEVKVTTKVGHLPVHQAKS